MISSNLWLGHLTTYEAVLAAKLQAIANYGSKTEAPTADLLTVQGNVGIIDIQGSLVNGNAGFMSYFGVTGYGDIRDALVAAIQHPDVNAILLNIDSGGGAVAGVHETAQFISRVSTIKPVVSYNGGTEASAALWLGSSAQESYVAETGLTGSLGILMVHAEKSAQLMQEGIKVTVIRAGDEKALANPYEALTPNAKANLESKAQAMYDVFLGHVAAMRGMPVTSADKAFGQGKEFVGKQAVAVGLVDNVGTLEDAYAAAAALGAKKAAKTTPKNAPSRMTSATKAVTPTLLTANLTQVLGTELTLEALAGDNASTHQGSSMSKPFTVEQLAAMAAGVTLDVVAPTAEELAAKAEAEAVQAAADKLAAEALAATEAAKVVAGGASELVDFLKKQTTDLQAQVMTLTMEAKTAKEAVEAIKPNMDALAEIARNSVRTMTVALGGKADAVAALSATDVVAEHARVSAVFKDKYKVGAVAATNTSVEETKPAKVFVDPIFASAVKSVTPVTK